MELKRAGLDSKYERRGAMYRLQGDVTAPGIHCNIYHVVQTPAFQLTLVKVFPEGLMHCEGVLVGNTIQMMFANECHIADIGMAITINLRNRSGGTLSPVVELWGYEWILK